MKINAHPKVFIIIPVHNRINYTVDCIESLKQISYKNYQIVVIDDGSTDGTEEILNEKYPEVKVVKGDGNLWWSGAINKGIEYAIKENADYVLTLNNDVMVDKDFLTYLVESAESEENTLVSSIIYHYDAPEKVWFAGGGISWIGKGGIYILYKIDNDKCKWLTGMSVLIRTSYFNDIGLVDNRNFPHYMGDCEFSHRAYKKGYKLKVEGKSKIWNKTESTGIYIDVFERKLSLIRLFNDMKSHANFRANFLFYKKYSQSLLFLLSISLRYYYVVFKPFLVRWLKKILMR
jgi:GT2 family glycosyltransferase